jgi:ubiquinone/menaquinone biosynthesis C-methylase UbiE
MDTLHKEGYGHKTQHGHEHRHRHTQTDAPQTEGLLIRRARFYDLRLWLMFLGRIGAVRALPLDLAAIRSGERVLDVGCGTGELTLAAARRVGPGAAVYGIDAAPEMIEVARRKAKRSGRTVHFLVEPVEALNFPDGSFDVVLSSFMMHHLPADLKRRALAEIGRVLRPGGRLVIVDLQATSRLPRLWQPGWLVIRLHKQRAASAAEVRVGEEARAALLREAGFVKVESGATRYPWIGYTLGWVPDRREH